MNARAKYLMGWISHEQASAEITGHPPDQETPRLITAAGEPEFSTFPVSDGDTGNQNATNIAPRIINNIPAGFEISDREISQANQERARRHKPAGWDDPNEVDVARWVLEGHRGIRILPELPLHGNVTDADILAAIRIFDDTMPEFAGMLDATLPDEIVTNSEWEYLKDAKVYRHKESGYIVDGDEQVVIRDTFMDRSEVHLSIERMIRIMTLAMRPGVSRGTEVQVAVEKLVSGEISTGRWLLDMRQAVKQEYIAQYCLGMGGRNNMAAADWGRIGRMLAPNGQYEYLQRFAEEIELDNLSPAQIQARANLYVQSSAQAFEKGRASTHGITLPNYPGDGSTQCLTNCRCMWDYDPNPDGLDVWWVLDAAADHCADCLNREGEYAPLSFNLDGSPK